ncbi:MAG: hypothetical protein E7617_07480 [Ruminococcaceae bacterium]|nr:hypothetical protein [Oscillospiraceae bacterium]
MISFILNNTALLHASHEGHSGITEFLSEKLGSAGLLIEEVLLHGIIDTLKLIPFLFLTYLLMELLEHRAGEKMVSFIGRSGRLGPAIGGIVGAVPQCGFSSVASNLYTGRVITAGTLIAVFLSTSDEMLPILIGNPDISARALLFILAYKICAAIAVGFAADGVLRLMKRGKPEINIDELCDNDNCHCERGILYSALHHTLSISLFILLVTIVINAAVFLIGYENLSAVMYDKPFISHLIAALFGLIPNCAASVALTEFYTSGLITLGTMLAGLFSGAGVGTLILFRVNKHPRENIYIILTLIGSGVVFGLLADLVGFAALIG